VRVKRRVIRTFMSAFAIRTQSELDVPVAGRMKKSIPGMFDPHDSHAMRRTSMCWSDSIALGNLEPSKPWLIKTTAFEQFIEDRFGFFPDVPSGDSVFQNGVKINAFSLV